MLPAANVVCRDAHPTPNALAVSGDGRLLAFVGPSKYVVTVMTAACLEEVSWGPLCPCGPGQHTLHVPRWGHVALLVPPGRRVVGRDRPSPWAWVECQGVKGAGGRSR